MSKSWHKLIDRYDPLFHEIQFEIECELGWYDLVEAITVKLQQYNEKCLCQEDMIWPLQIKEKYGELRYYISSAPKEIRDFIAEQTEKSRTICEKCGQPGETYGKNWVYTHCNDCRSQLKAHSS